MAGEVGYTGDKEVAMFRSEDFALYVLHKAGEAGIADMNLTKLQKLLYICDGIMLSYGENLINEHARAWNYGPVYPKVYKWYSKHRGKVFNLPLDSKFVQDIESRNCHKVVEKVLSTFGSWTAVQLSDWSHLPGSPWETALSVSGGKMNAVIDKDVMKEYFGGLLEK